MGAQSISIPSRQRVDRKPSKDFVRLFSIFRVNERFKNDLENKLENLEISDGSIFRLIVKTLIPKTPLMDGNYESVASLPEYHRIIEAAHNKFN